MGKTVLVVLQGTPDGEVPDSYSLFQEATARAVACDTGISVEIAMAPGFDHLRIIRKRLAEVSAAPLDAVLVEPHSVSAMGLILKALKGQTGLVFLNAWSPEVEAYRKDWGQGLPLGTVSVNHRTAGRIQARQVACLLPRGGHVLLVSGPLRSSPASDGAEGLRSNLPSGIQLSEVEAGKWTEADGITAFESWYRLQRARAVSVDVIVAQSDQLAMGARAACQAVANVSHRETLTKARLLGADACPTLGKMLVDTGQLTASVATPATTGDAITRLQRLWESGQPLALRALVEPQPYPSSSVGATG